MKKIFLSLIALLIFISCSSTPKSTSLIEKYSITKDSAKNWDTTIANVIMAEAEIPEWYGDENPILNLRKARKMSEKDFYFLDNLGKQNASEISDEDFEHFIDLLEKYVSKLPRRFFLDNTNIKDPIGLAKYIVTAANSPTDNPSKHIKETVAEKEEWELIVSYSQKADLKEKEVRKFRKLLNKFIGRKEFYNSDIWFQQEISDRTVQLSNLNKKDPKSKIELNNINAKALYVAYSTYFSRLDKWSR